MDVMSLRRGLMMGMASGAEYVKGSFTVPESVSNYTIDFGKTFNKYLFLIEADEDSKTAILNSDVDANKTYAMIGIFPTPLISSYTFPSNASTFRINPSTKLLTSGSPNVTATSTSLQITCSSLTGSSANVLYRGLTYNYYVVEIK